MSICLTVYFDDPFWAGLFERSEDGRTQVCKVTFGAEPKDAEVLAFCLGSWDGLRFGKWNEGAVKPLAGNPKRIRRTVRRAAKDSGIGTRSQRALAAQREENKAERRAISRQEAEEEKRRRYEMRALQKKERKKGR